MTIAILLLAGLSALAFAFRAVALRWRRIDEWFHHLGYIGQFGLFAGVAAAGLAGIVLIL